MGNQWCTGRPPKAAQISRNEEGPYTLGNQETPLNNNKEETHPFKEVSSELEDNIEATKLEEDAKDVSNNNVNDVGKGHDEIDSRDEVDAVGASPIVSSDETTVKLERNTSCEDFPRVVTVVKSVIDEPKNIAEEQGSGRPKLNEATPVLGYGHLPSNGRLRHLMTNQYKYSKVAEFPPDTVAGARGEMAALMENMKSGLASTRQAQLSQQLASSQTQVTSTTTQMVSNSTCSSSSSSSRQSASARLHHLTSAEMAKSDLSELKNSITEMKNLSNFSVAQR